MGKIIPNGTEVLIFNNERQHDNQLNQVDFVKGTIINSKQSDDLSPRGSHWHVQIYTILGDDGKEYIGTYGSSIVGDCFIRTIDSHIEYLKSSFKSNLEKIEGLQNENVLLYKKISELYHIKHTDTQESQTMEETFTSSNSTARGHVLKKIRSLI